jgi:hypothetical protein
MGLQNVDWNVVIADPRFRRAEEMWPELYARQNIGIRVARSVDH